MKSLLDQIYKELGIKSRHLRLNKLPFQPQCEVKELQVVDIDFEGKPFVLHCAAAVAWRKMKSAASREKLALCPLSGFRSYLHQKRQIQNELKTGAAIKSILCYIAIPGFSEHHTGRAIDIHVNGKAVLERAFEKTNEFSWLSENAADFGFEMSYPRSGTSGIIYEPWHWLYVGRKKRARNKAC